MSQVYDTELPVDFISHGGGPWPWMPEDRETAYAKLTEALAALLPSLPQQPKAILMISAHWEERVFTVQSTAKPGMIYDYYGFPDYTYSIRYSSMGSPALAQRAAQLLRDQGLEVGENAERGYDHGLFSPMEIINPKADIPVVQLSLKKGLRPDEHLALGRALRPLRSEGIFIIGSGLSYHNLAMFDRRAEKPSREFDIWLNETVTQKRGQERNQSLEAWETAPAARLCHPREEHLIPLMVAVGCAEEQSGIATYNQPDFMGGIHISNFRFGS